MNGFDKLREQIEGKKNSALVATVDYLLTRNDMENKYLNEEKSIEEMEDFIKANAEKTKENNWNFVTNEVVFAWAVMYYSFPNSFLKIEKKKQKESKKTENTKTTNKNNVIELNEAREKLEKKKEIEQISIFGGGEV